MSAEQLLVAADALQSVGIELFRAAGLARDHAETIVRVQIEADLRGMHSHGMRAVPTYLDRIEREIINRRAKPDVTIDRGLAATIDGDAGPGQVVACLAMDLAITKAHQHGIGAVAVRNSNHFGAAGYYARMALPDLIGFATTNGNLAMAPWGALQYTLGNNPLAYAIPAGDELPLVLDIATSQVAEGKIDLLAAEGLPLPAGWALDAAGGAAQNVAEALAGLGIPLGAPTAGHKGFGLALILEALAGGLAGARVGREHTRNVEDGPRPWDEGHFFMAIDPSLFGPLDAFKRRVDRIARDVHAAPQHLGGEKSWAPGEQGWERRARALQEGIAMPRSILANLEHQAIKRGIRVDWVH